MAANALKRVLAGLVEAILNKITMAGILLWDGCLTFINTVTSNKQVGRVVAQGNPGASGIWPQYIAPTESDSRCSCPALNALANHGLLPRDGKNIQFKQLGTAVNATYRFAPSFCYFVPWFCSQFLQRSYSTGTLDLKDLDVHNCIEHDASLTRWDVVRQPDQSKPAADLIDDLLASATGDGGRTLTAADLSRFTGKRRAHSKATNGQYTLTTGQRFFGSSNSSTMLRFFGGNVEDLRVFLKEERLPDGWENKCRSQMGLTISEFNFTVSKVEFAIDEDNSSKKTA